MRTWHVPSPMRGDAVFDQLVSYVHGGDYLLHGSRTAGLRVLEPRAPIDFSVDDFSKTTAVYATEDPTWAMGYALRTAEVSPFLNACFYPAARAGQWSARRIFLSYARTASSRWPLSPGVVYVLPSAGFRRMPSYTNRQLGHITECQWIATEPVPVVAEIPVTPENLPLRPRRHDPDLVPRRATDEPDGFPWL